MDRGELRTLYVIGENPAQSEADVAHARKLLAGLDFLLVQDIVMTKTAEMADVVLPGSASWCEAEGTVTNSERRVQRVRKALDPPGEAREDTWIIAELARRLGHDWGEPTAEQIWDELRSLSPMHRGMRYDRLEREGGLQWPCLDEDHPGSPFLHGRLWEKPRQGPAAPFSAVEHQPPFEALDADYPIRLTTGRRLESYNTGVQSNLYRSPLHRGESLDLSPEDVERLLLEDGEIVKVSSRRGSVEAPVRIDPSLRPGLAFMTLHFPDQVDTNVLTIDATDPKSGTAEFKAAAIRVEKLAGDAGRGGRQDRRARGRLRRLTRAAAASSQARIGSWIFACSTPSPPRPSAPRSTTCSAPLAPAGTGARATPRSTGGSRSRAAPTGRRSAATCSCRRSMPSRSTSAGSAPARSTTSAGG